MYKSRVKNKSVGINKRTENMLKMLKADEPELTETEFFLRGIRIQFEEKSKIKNEAFRKDMQYAIKHCFPKDIETYSIEAEQRLKTKFDKLCDLLEILCPIGGLLLIQEFAYFIEYVCCGTSIEDIRNGKTDYRKIYKPCIAEFEKIYNTILENKDEKDLQIDLKELEAIFKNTQVKTVNDSSF